MQGAVSQQTIRVLRRLMTLFGLGQILGNMGDFLESGFLTPSQAGMAREAQYQVDPHPTPHLRSRQQASCPLLLLKCQLTHFYISKGKAGHRCSRMDQTSRPCLLRALQI